MHGKAGGDFPAGNLVIKFELIAFDLRHRWPNPLARKEKL